MSKVCATQPRPAIKRPVFGWSVNAALALFVEVRHRQRNGFRLRFVSFSPGVVMKDCQWPSAERDDLRQR
jgi:hypothetical protein